MNRIILLDVQGRNGCSSFIRDAVVIKLHIGPVLPAHLHDENATTINVCPSKPDVTTGIIQRCMT